MYGNRPGFCIRLLLIRLTDDMTAETLPACLLLRDIVRRIFEKLSGKTCTACLLVL